MFEIELLMYKNWFGIDNLQWLICDQTKPNQNNIYFHPFSFLVCLLSSDLFPPFAIFLFSSLYYLFPQLLKCWKIQKSFVWRNSSVNKERNITTTLVVSIWFIHFSTYFYHLIRFAKIYHFSLPLSLSLSLSLSVYIYTCKRSNYPIFIFNL